MTIGARSAAVAFVYGDSLPLVVVLHQRLFRTTALLYFLPSMPLPRVYTYGVQSSEFILVNNDKLTRNPPREPLLANSGRRR